MTVTDVNTAIDCLGRITDDDIDAFAPHDRSMMLKRLAALQGRVDAVEARVLAKFDARKEWSPAARSPQAWLRSVTGVAPPTAARKVRRARHLRTLPKTAELLDGGRISTDRVDRIIAADNSRVAAALRDQEALILNWACTKKWTAFCNELAYWVQEHDPGLEPDERDGRYLHLSRTLHDAWALDGWLDPIDGTIVNTELARLERHLFDRDWKDAKERLGHEPSVGELSRTASQRRADALVEMATRSAISPKHGKRPKPLVTILAGHDGFNRMCELADGTVVSPAEAARALGDAVIEVVWFQGPRRVLGVSRKRTFTGAVRRAIEVRDRFCTDEHCELPADQCEGDHIVWYSRGGLTSQDNGRLRCGHDNRKRTESADLDAVPVRGP